MPTCTPPLNRSALSITDTTPPNARAIHQVREFDAALPLVRDVFPRPYALSRLPMRDISMQSVQGEQRCVPPLVPTEQQARRSVACHAEGRVHLTLANHHVSAHPLSWCEWLPHRSPLTPHRSPLTAHPSLLNPPSSNPSDFSLYQGVWRMQPLPGCAPEGGDAMRLTYAVELRPSLPVPVALLEAKIATDLANNLKVSAESFHYQVPRFAHHTTHTHTPQGDPRLRRGPTSPNDSLASNLVSGHCAVPWPLRVN